MFNPGRRVKQSLLMAAKHWWSNDSPVRSTSSWQVKRRVKLTQKHQLIKTSGGVIKALNIGQTRGAKGWAHTAESGAGSQPSTRWTEDDAQTSTRLCLYFYNQCQSIWASLSFALVLSGFKDPPSWILFFCCPQSDHHKMITKTTKIILEAWG